MNDWDHYKWILAEWSPLFMLVGATLAVVMALAVGFGVFSPDPPCVPGDTFAVCTVYWCANDIADKHNIYNITVAPDGEFIIYYERVCSE